MCIYLEREPMSLKTFIVIFRLKPNSKLLKNMLGLASTLIPVATK
jgi:hypothetical protein